MAIKESINSDYSLMFTPENWDIINNLNSKQIPLKDTGIPPRIFNYWKKCGLIGRTDKIDGKRKWEILSFVEFVWLKCIKEMRDFGISFEIIKKAQGILFEELDLALIKNIMQKRMKEKATMSKIKSQINKMIREINRYDLNEKEKEKIISSLSTSDSIIEEVLAPLALRHIDYFLLSAILFRQDLGFIISKTKVIPYIFDMLKEDTDNKNKTFLLESHIYISINRLYFQFLNETNKQKYFSTFTLLNSNEREIFEFMKKEEFQEIKIKRDTKQTIITGKLKIPYIVEDYHDWKKKTKLIYPYCEINEKQYEGKISSIEFTVKEIIKK
jgi:hypothetical protein